MSTWLGILAKFGDQRIELNFTDALGDSGDLGPNGLSVVAQRHEFSH